MYFIWISSLINLTKAMNSREWYSAFHWAIIHRREGGKISEEEWDEILHGLVEFDERYDEDYRKKNRSPFELLVTN